MSAFLVGWLLLCGVSAFAQPTQTFNANLNLQSPDPTNPWQFRYKVNDKDVLKIVEFPIPPGDGGHGLHLFIGIDAGLNTNTLGAPNTFVGNSAGFLNTTGSGNNFVGFRAGYANSTGSYNTFVGNQAGYVNTTGLHNVFTGYLAGVANTSGRFNTFIGDTSGVNNTTGSFNTSVGGSAGPRNQAGSYNIFLGYLAGQNNLTGGNNIYIGNSGMTTNESYTLRLGSPWLTGGCVGPWCGIQHTYMAGIYGNWTTSGKPVFIDSSGKLGTSGAKGLVTSFNNRTDDVVPKLGDYPAALLGDGHPTPSTFLRGDNTWATPGSTSGVTSFNGRVGIVSSQFSDYPATLLGTGTPNDKTFLNGDRQWVELTGGSGSYINNGTSQQTADFNISGTGTAKYFNSVVVGENESKLSSYWINSKPVLGIGCGNSDIYLGSTLCNSEENNTIRIGDYYEHTSVYIPSIGNNYVNSPTHVVTIDDQTGKLGISSATHAPDQVIKVQQHQIQALEQQVTELLQRMSRLEAFIPQK